ncbi:hypothetical protein Pcaca05_00120 [Pectobacterium carotovorum subsp. carotovorum]|nr:hypothetical protein Pcaca05_00120 [Pectobacterium carotovorum subsp. carotovorum]
MQTRNTKLIIFSDLDGSLLDHETYRWDAAQPWLTRLANEGIPLVWFCVGYTLASRRSDCVALHDCDIVTYDRAMLARLLYPVANPHYALALLFVFHQLVARFLRRITHLAAPPWPTFASRFEGRLFLNRIVETGVTLDPRRIARLNDRMPFIIYIDIRHKQHMKTVREK